MWGEPDGDRAAELKKFMFALNMKTYNHFILTEEIIQSCSEYRQSQKASKDLMWAPSVALSPQHTEPSFSIAVLSILFIKKNDK